jgi:hypothetical protein
MREVGAALVVSFAHVWDFTRATDEATRRRVGAAVDSFPLAVFMTDDPTRGERDNLQAYGERDDWRGPPSDLLPQQLKAIVVTDFAGEALLNTTVVPQVEQLVGASMQMTEAEAFAREVARDAAVAPAKDATVQAFELLAHAESADELLAFVRAEQLKPAGAAAQVEANWPQTEAAVRAQWAAFAPMRKQFQAQFGAGEVAAERAARLMLNKSGLSSINFAGANIRGDASRRTEIMAWLSPGLALVAALAQRHDKNVARDPRYSDRADLEHMKYVPYVDLATVDAANFEVVSRLRSKLRCPRQVRVLRNPQKGSNASAALEEVIASIRALSGNSP